MSSFVEGFVWRAVAASVEIYSGMALESCLCFLGGLLRSASRVLYGPPLYLRGPWRLFFRFAPMRSQQKRQLPSLCSVFVYALDSECHGIACQHNGKHIAIRWRLLESFAYCCTPCVCGSRHVLRQRCVAQAYTSAMSVRHDAPTLTASF